MTAITDTDTARRLQTRAARFARLIELGAPSIVLETEYWLVTEAYLAVRKERSKRELDQYEGELRVQAEQIAKTKHLAAFPGTPWDTATDFYRNSKIKQEFAALLDVDVKDLP